MYTTHNEGKSVTAKRFIKTLKAKIYEKVTANDSKSYLPYLNKLVDQYNNTCHNSINKKSINVNYCLKKLKQIIKHLNLNLNLIVGHMKIKI